MALNEPEPGDWEKLLSLVERLLGDRLPAFVTWPIGLLVLVTLILIVLAVAIHAITKIKDAWQSHLRPKAYSPEQRQRAEGRRQFAQHLQLEIVAKNQKENWRDQQFAELEAEIEAEGRRWRPWPFSGRSNGIRREKSLTIALRHSKERLILVEGDPGTGKSVALRHVAHELAVRASKARSLTSRLPVYVNLKEIKRPIGRAVDRNLIRDFVLTSLNRVNDRFVDEFIEQEFDVGLRCGSWVFLFDSFDEIPDVLSSTESDATIEQYSGAISDFLSGINSCRGVVASRHYRGPQRTGWHSFRILELQPSRQYDLIKRSVLGKPELAQQIRENLVVASDDVRILARNPMLLGLLCEHVKLGHVFPATSHEVLSKYIDYRFSRDEPRVTARFKINADELRTFAENCAFAMTADTGIGLSPTVRQLKEAMVHQGVTVNSDKFADFLHALVYMKLGRSSDSEGSADEQEFTFSHRRFQEHFTTCVVLRDAKLVTERQLLADARWRETAVTLLQTGDPEAVKSLLASAHHCVMVTPEQLAAVENSIRPCFEPFPWAPAQLHVLRILEAGTLGGLGRIPDQLRSDIGKLLILASGADNLLDRKLALEVAGTAPHDVLIELMQDALATGSVWLSDIVYQQASRLASPVLAIYRSVRISVLRLSRSGALQKEYIATKAYLSRLPSPENLLAALQLAVWAPKIDILLLPMILIIATYFIDSISIGIAVCACGIYWISGLLFRRTELDSPIALLGSGLRIGSCMIAYLSAPYVSISRAQLKAKCPDKPGFVELILGFPESLEICQPNFDKFSIPQTFDHIHVAFVVSLASVSIWYWAAEWNVRRGRYLNPVFWPFYAALFCWDILITTFSRPAVIMQFVSMAITILLIPFMMFVIIPAFPPARFVIIGLLVAGTVAFTALLAGVSAQTVRELLFLARWQRNHRLMVDAVAFENLCAHVTLPWVRVPVLRWLADKPLSGSTTSWVRYVGEAIDASSAAMTTLVKQTGGKNFASDRLIVRNRLLRNIFRSSFIEQHDRLYRLLERVTASSRTL